MIRRAYYGILLSFLVLPISISQVVFRKPLYYIPKKISVIGKGIAIEEGNLSNFYPIKIFLGKLLIYLPEMQDWVETSIGIVKVGRRTYKLVVDSFKNGSLVARIREKETQNIAGKISLNYTVKDWQGFWVGELEIGNTTYRVYMMEERRIISPKPFLRNLPKGLLEKAKEKLGDVTNLSQKVMACLSNPKGEECKELLERCKKERGHLCNVFVNTYCKIVGECGVEGG